MVAQAKNRNKQNTTNEKFKEKFEQSLYGRL